MTQRNQENVGIVYHIAGQFLQHILIVNNQPFCSVTISNIGEDAEGLDNVHGGSC